MRGTGIFQIITYDRLSRGKPDPYQLEQKQKATREQLETSSSRGPLEHSTVY